LVKKEGEKDMKSLLIIVVTMMAFLLLPVLAYAQTYEATAAGPPMEQPLLREGTLAVTLAGALQLGQTASEVDAESLLSKAGIAPRNGWIADYPVTPDIAAELRSAVADAATAGSLTMGEDEALAAYDDVMTQYSLLVKADSSGQMESEQSAPGYPDTAMADGYYSDYGPPVVTYYAPPVNYAYLYTWVPYPFWWWSVWFPGFFVLVDFNVPVFVNGHACFVSNHFFDRHHRTFVRIDAFDRFHSKTFANTTTVVGPATVSAGAQTTFKRFESRTINREFGTDGNVRMMRSTSGSRKVVPQGGNTITTAPNKGNWSVQGNRSYRTFSPYHRSNTFSRSVAENRALGRASAISGQFEGSTRTYAPPSRSHSAPAPRQVSPSFGGSRPFEGFRGGSFGGGRWR
jgi:hypothetical protein